MARVYGARVRTSTAAKRDLELTRKQREERIRGRLPEAGEIAVRGARRPVGHGFSSETLLFELSYRQDGEERREDVVVRIEPTGFCVFPRYDVALQVRVMQALGDSGVPVPRMCRLEQGPACLGDPVQDLAWWLASDRCFTEGISVERLPGIPDRAARCSRADPGL
jgi:aminoglycoside phosphotransferase (APT) family kinase protein